MKLAVCGGRNFSDKARAFDSLTWLHSIRKITTLIHGGCTGADALAGQWAFSKGVFCIVEHAQWSVHGHSAGPIRNQKIIDVHRPEMLLAFPGFRGTADMIDRAVRANIIVEYG